jgi:hypothetical protein
MGTETTTPNDGPVRPVARLLLEAMRDETIWTINCFTDGAHLVAGIKGVAVKITSYDFRSGDPAYLSLDSIAIALSTKEQHKLAEASRKLRSRVVRKQGKAQSREEEAVIAKLLSAPENHQP